MQLNLIVLFSICICIENSHQRLRPNDGEDSSILSDFVTQIFINYFGSVRKIALRYSKQFVGITKIIQSIKSPITINAEESPLEEGLDIREPSEVVFLMEETTNVSTHLNNSLWTSETHFFLALNELNNTEKTLKEIFKMFKVANVINVIALVASSDNVSMYSYVPFNFQDCDSVKLLLLGTKTNEITLENHLNNLHGCFLNVSIVDLPPMIIKPKSKNGQGSSKFEGTEIGIMQEISKKVNFTPRFAVPRDGEAWGWIHPRPRGVVGEVYSKQSYFGIGLLASTLERYETLDMTVPVSPLRECITSVVPKGAAKSQATWVKIYLNEFPQILWCCIAFVFVLGTFTFWSITRIFEMSSYSSIVFYMYSAFLNVPVKSPDWAPLRSLFLAWIWYSFIVIVSYQSLMGSELTVSYRVRDINTIRDLLETDLPLTGLYNTFRLINYEAEGDIKKLASRFQSTNYGMTEAVRHIVFDRNISYLRETTSFKYFTILNPQARGKVHFMKECFYEYYPIMVLQRRSPLTKIANRIITQLFESGILMKWRRQYINEIYQSTPSAIRLTLRHMSAPFIALIFGLALSIVSFIMENYYYSVTNRGK